MEKLLNAVVALTSSWSSNMKLLEQARNVGGSYSLQGVKNALTIYGSPVIVRSDTIIIAVCFRFVQMFILAYVVGYVLAYKKGYQRFEMGISSVVAKVKGSQRTPLGSTLDAADFVTPPLENNALFITTAFVFTHKQVSGVCAELDMPGARCFYDYHCLPGQPVARGSGFMTGSCNTTTATCQVSAWCPVDDSKAHQNSTIRLRGGEQATILIKNFILFPKNAVKRRNIGDDLSAEYLRDCVYNPETDPFCPIFVLGDIVSLAGANYSNMAYYGAILSFVIEWKCNLDFDISHCVPKYSFRRLDADHEHFPGWNFRHSGQRMSTETEGERQRSLTKSTGIRIIFNVQATAGKFSVIKTTLVLGSSLGVLSLASNVFDFVILKCQSIKQEALKKNEKYKHQRSHSVSTNCSAWDLYACSPLNAITNMPAFNDREKRLASSQRNLLHVSSTTINNCSIYHNPNFIRR